MEHWYHPNGFHCFVSLDKDKETLRERGWKSSPFKGVCYRHSDFCAGGVFPYGPWVMNTPIAPRVSAPVFSYVDAFDLTDNITGLEQSAYISDAKTNNTLGQFSPLSLIMNLSGVPRNPKAARI